MKIKDALDDTTRTLMRYGIYNPGLEARLLLRHASKHSEEYLIAHGETLLTTSQIAILEDAIVRRKNSEPIAYILGYKEFYGKNFKVSRDVLIPRPDSETLIDYILKDYLCKPKLSILDLGTGSGCLIITLLLALQDSHGVAVDIEPSALEIAKENAATYNLQNIDFIVSDWFNIISRVRQFDIIVANPPYIATTDDVAKETVMHEPHNALFELTRNGLKHYETIAEYAKHFLKPYGHIYLEIGYNQANDVTAIYKDAGYNIAGTMCDLEGRTRCLKYQHNPHTKSNN